MALGKLLKSLFGGTPDATNTDETCGDPIEYKGFTIEAAPFMDKSSYNTAGYISGELDGEIKRIRFIRADQNTDKQLAVDHSISKARQIIDEQGLALLTKSHL